MRPEEFGYMTVSRRSPATKKGFRAFWVRSKPRPSHLTTGS